VSYQQQNLGGNNQNLGAELQMGQRELLFDVPLPIPGLQETLPNFLHSQCLQTSVDFVDFDGGEDEVNLQ